MDFGRSSWYPESLLPAYAFLPILILCDVMLQYKIIIFDIELTSFLLNYIINMHPITILYIINCLMNQNIADKFSESAPPYPNRASYPLEPV